MATASIYSLESRLEVFAASKAGSSNDTFRLERIVSYDNGETWVDNWIRHDTLAYRSSLAASITGDSLDTFIVGRGMDDRLWFSRLAELYELKNAGAGPIGAGVFTGKPAICSHGTSKTSWQSLNVQDTSYAGVKVMVFSKGMDQKIWWAVSTNGGNSWDMAWSPIGAGTFSSSPSATCSADGKLVAVFAKGMDDKIWWAYSINGASSWNMAWAPIGGKFTSAPAAVCSADGKRIYVFARGEDNRIWWAFATNGVERWDMAWAPIGDGVFESMPSANCSWDGKIIHIFAKGNDNRIWQARSFDFGATWNIAWRKIHSKQFSD